MKKLIAIITFSLGFNSYAGTSVTIQDFSGNYQVSSCKLGGLLLLAYAKNDPELMGTDKKLKHIKIELDTKYNGLAINLLEANGTENSRFGSATTIDALAHLNKGRITWEDSSWGTKYFSKTSLVGKKFCYSGSDQGDVCMKLSDDFTTINIKFTPNVGINLECKAIRQ